MGGAEEIDWGVEEQDVPNQSAVSVHQGLRKQKVHGDGHKFVVGQKQEGGERLDGGRLGVHAATKLEKQLRELRQGPFHQVVDVVGAPIGYRQTWGRWERAGRKR